MFKQLIVFFVVILCVSTQAQTHEETCRDIKEITQVISSNLHVTNDHLEDYFNSYRDEHDQNPGTVFLKTDGLIEYWEAVLYAFRKAYSLANHLHLDIGVLRGVDLLEDLLEDLSHYDEISYDDYFYDLYWYEDQVTERPFNHYFSMCPQD